MNRKIAVYGQSGIWAAGKCMCVYIGVYGRKQNLVLKGNLNTTVSTH